MMDASYERKRFAHHDNTDMDHSYSHLKLKESEILTDMASAVETPYPKKPLDKAVVAHCGVERLKTGSMWADHCAFRGINISPVVQVGDEQKHRFYAKYKTGTKEPLHIHAKASTEWVVLSGKFDIETGPVYAAPALKSPASEDPVSPSTGRLLGQSASPPRHSGLSASPPRQNGLSVPRGGAATHPSSSQVPDPRRGARPSDPRRRLVPRDSQGPAPQDPLPRVRRRLCVVRRKAGHQHGHGIRLVRIVL